MVIIFIRSVSSVLVSWVPLAVLCVVNSVLVISDIGARRPGGMGSQEEAVGPRGGEVQVGEERQREELMCELGAAVERALQGGGDRALGRAITASERILCHGSSQVSSINITMAEQCSVYIQM